MAQLHSELKSWTASSEKLADAVENKRKYILPTTSDWTCTICERAIKCAPVYQCTKGHLSCSLCHKNGKCCTLCPTDAPSSIRNLAVETIIESMEIPCKFAPLGCKETCKFKEENHYRWRHEESCSFKPMKCPMPGCLQAGVEHGLPEHLSTKHNISRFVDFEDDSYSPTDEKYAGKFELKPSTGLILMRMPSRDGEQDGWEHYLLHQDSPTWGETLRITALEDGFTALEGFGKPTFKLEVLASDEDGTYLYSLRGKSTSSKQQGGMLILPKHPVGAAFKCKVSLLNVGEDDKVDFDRRDDDD